MSSFLKKFFETSIYAATTLFVAKLVGIWVGLLATGSRFTFVATEGSIINSIVVESTAQVQSVSIIGGLVFISIIVIAVMIILAKTILFNDLTRSPRVLVKVIHYNLSSWIEDGKDMYPKLFSWGIFLWLAVISLFGEFRSNIIPLYIPFILAVFAVFYTYQVFAYLDTHISDMISYLYGEKTRKA